MLKVFLPYVYILFVGHILRVILTICLYFTGRPHDKSILKNIVKRILTICLYFTGSPHDKSIVKNIVKRILTNCIYFTGRPHDKNIVKNIVKSILTICIYLGHMIRVLLRIMLKVFLTSVYSL